MLHRIAPRQRGAWIETSQYEISPDFLPASPLGNGGRGLKRQIATSRGGLLRIAPRQRGAWIETARLYHAKVPQASIAPRQRGAWIETALMRFFALR